MQSDNDLLRQFRQYLAQDQQFKQLLRNTPMRGGENPPWLRKILQQPLHKPKPSQRVPNVKLGKGLNSEVPVIPGPVSPGRLAMLYKLARLRRLNIGLELFLEWQQQKFERQIEKMGEQQYLIPGGVEIGPHWNQTVDCGPWREDNVVPGGNFCFVHLGVPAVALLRAVPPGFLSFYTVQNDGTEVPGGIDCTHAKSYESPDLNPDPQPRFRPPTPYLPLPPEQPITPENPFLPYTMKWGPIRGFPPAVPVPLANNQPGHNPAPNRPRQRRWSNASPWRRTLPHTPPTLPPHPVRPPRIGEKEIKGRFKLAKWMKLALKFKPFVEGTLETLDILDAAYNALPWSVRKPYLAFGKQPTPQQKAAILWLEITRVNPKQYISQLAINLVEMEATDMGIGKIGQKLTQAVRGNPYWVSPVGLQAGGRYRGPAGYETQPVQKE